MVSTLRGYATETTPPCGGVNSGRRLRVDSGSRVHRSAGPDRSEPESLLAVLGRAGF